MPVALAARRDSVPRMRELTAHDIVCAVRAFHAQWRPALSAATPLAHDQNLLECLDSFGFVELLLHLEETFGVSIRTADMELSEIVMLDRLVAHVLACAKPVAATEGADQRNEQIP